MNKNVRKVRPADYWRIGEHESWFSDMSAKGWHLHKMGIQFAHFKKGDPKRMEYRIEVTEKKGMSLEQSEMYEGNGWDYVTSYHYFHVFSSPEENHAPELHTDPMEQSFTLDQLNEKLIFNFIGTLIGFLLIIGMLSAVWFLDGTPILRLVEGFVVQQTFISLIIFYNVFISTRAMLSIQALRRNLKEGKTIDHHAPWEKRLRRNTVLSIIIAITIIIGTILPFIQLFKYETFTLPKEDTNLPIVRLADIEQNPLLIRDEYYIDEIDWGNHYTSNWSIIAPVQYESNENGVIENQKWLDESGIYSPSLSSEVYYLRSKIFVKPLISDLMKWHLYGDETKLFVEKQHPSFDQLMICEDKGWKQLVASKGKVVMYIRYSGNAEMNVLIENVAQKISVLAGK
ncbi:DUF2812 domain-containing protein [Solibacillus sp. FSL K6-1523]|uniref:DUF2812 domain-containing protein n=1 Tax=Solibacillus sp. FSL K6-1523 TaxID=2921471 RepID=UPI0030F8947A